MFILAFSLCFFFFNDTATTEIYTLSLHDALPIYRPFRRAGGTRDGGAPRARGRRDPEARQPGDAVHPRSEEHTSELQSRLHLVCRLLLEKKKKTQSKMLAATRHTMNTSNSSRETT